MAITTWFCQKLFQFGQIISTTQSSRLGYLICLCLLGFWVYAPAQSQKVTLILQGGEEIPCQLEKINSGYLYFKAASSSLAFKYGDGIEIEKVAKVRLGDGRTLSMKEFLALKGGSAPSPAVAEETPAPQPPPRSPEPAPGEIAAPKPPSGPGMRLTTKLLDTTRAQSAVGLRLPEIPPPQPSTEIDYTELSNLLAEAGLAGKLLAEINSGVLQGRILTKNQKALVDALAQSPVWMTRKQDLREAHRVAEGEFNMLTRSQTNLLAEVFHFHYTSSSQAFIEFVEFLNVENILHFQDKWEKVENVFGDEAAAALRDILNNYDDWHYLFGQEEEER